MLAMVTSRHHPLCKSRPPVPLVALSMALVVGVVSAQDTCRMAPQSRSSYCGLPLELANFQGYYGCPSDVKVGRPSNLQDAQALVAMFPKVKANGIGCSWWSQQFCSGNSSDAINIVMTEFQPVLDFIMNPVDPAQWKNSAPPSGFPIMVDEDNATVTVAAGIPQRLLLDYLSSYTYWKEKSGWTLPAFSWFIDQTIGGAVATGTHGSSMRWGSLSSQVRGLKVLLANGTMLEINNPEENLHLWRALGVSIGRLGIITELTMRIKPQQPVQRKLQNLKFEEFATQVKGTQDAYNAAVASGNDNSIKAALFQVDETQALWHYALDEIWRTDFQYFNHTPSGIVLNVNQANPEIVAMDGPPQIPAGDVFAQAKHEPVPPNPRITSNPQYWANFFALSLRGQVTPGTYEASKAYLSMTDFGTKNIAGFAPYNQLEVAVPLQKAGDCLLMINSEMYGSKRLWEGFRTPALIRFVTEEDFYLSPTHGGPRMYVNMEDYLSLSTGQPNQQFNEIVKLFLDKCDARLHWGKYGWPELDPCFDGATAYPESWCNFGCAVQELDPTGKFSSESNVWRWNATSNGKAVNFASCCTSQGFDNGKCTCAPSPVC